MKKDEVVKFLFRKKAEGIAKEKKELSFIYACYWLL